MKAIADTNVLLRASLRDDAQQADVARRILANAERVVVSSAALCEFVWVMRRQYGVPNATILLALNQLRQTASIVLDERAFDAGLQMLRAGGDFADGMIAMEGAALGGDAFLSFDKKAVKLLNILGHNAILLS